MSDKVIWADDPKFQEYKHDTFRTVLNKIKQDIQYNGESVLGMFPDRILFVFIFIFLFLFLSFTMLTSEKSWLVPC